MNSVPKTDASAPATIDFHFIEALSPTQPAAPRTVVTSEWFWQPLRRGRPLCRSALLGCRFDQTNRPWLLTANQSRASAGTAIPGTPACDGTLSNTWQPVQSKVCKVDSSLNLNCMGRPQKGQRGGGASMSMRLVVRS